MWETHGGVSANTAINITLQTGLGPLALKDPVSQHKNITKMETTRRRGLPPSELTSSTHQELESSSRKRFTMPLLLLRTNKKLQPISIVDHELHSCVGRKVGRDLIYSVHHKQNVKR